MSKWAFLYNAYLFVGDGSAIEADGIKYVIFYPLGYPIAK